MGDVAQLAVPIVSGVAVLGGSLALGMRHGIDWDHIAAITDITTSTIDDPPSGPGSEANDAERGYAGGPLAALATGGSVQTLVAPAGVREAPPPIGAISRLTAGRDFVVRRKRPLALGTLYALGHAAVVTALGVLAILFASVLPDWIDPIMGRVVGTTLLLLAVYLYVSIFRYLRGGSFQIRSRWMLIFAGVRNLYRRLRARLGGGDHHEIAGGPDQYGSRTAFGIGMIHGIGAETGTQALIIATAVGAGSRTSGVLALAAFVVGLLISNSFITVTSVAGAASANRRQGVFVIVGAIAATFSLVLGLVFIFGWDGLLPDLDPFLRWIGGPS
jgi:hypothetical protein